mmetsp:Transcript_26500/g.89165  ORF Transcript_26500/g.89165 Transcript_26500/m.89165 type:complete len:99 (+) Transcript_26500:190-486(+)
MLFKGACVFLAGVFVAGVFRGLCCVFLEAKGAEHRVPGVGRVEQVDVEASFAELGPECQVAHVPISIVGKPRLETAKCNDWPQAGPKVDSDKPKETAL